MLVARGGSHVHTVWAAVGGRRGSGATGGVASFQTFMVLCHIKMCYLIYSSIICLAEITKLNVRYSSQSLDSGFMFGKFCNNLFRSLESVDEEV